MRASPSTTELHERLAQLRTEERDRLFARVRASTIGTDRPVATLQASYQQRNFWILHQMAEHPQAYNSALVLSISGKIDPERLRRAVYSVCREYRIYRTVYVESDGDVKPVVLDDLALDYAFENLQGARNATEDAAFGAVDELARRPFNLDLEPPIRARLYRLAPEHHILGLIFHHIANDGGSLNLFWDAVRRAYESFSRGEVPSLPPEDDQYDSFARRQEERTSLSDLDDALRYWKEQLAGAPSCANFTFDYPAANGALEPQCEVVLPVGTLEERVGDFARSEGTTRNIVYLAAYYAWLYGETGSEDLVVGVPINGRMRREDEQVLGCCINMLGIRRQVRPDWTFRELVRKTRQVMLDGIRHAEMPFLRLVEEMDRVHSGSFGFYDTTFQYRNFIETFGPIDGCSVECHFLPRRFSQFPVMLEIYPLHGEPRVSLTYDTRLVRRARAERMLHRYRALLEASLASPDRSILEVTALESAERQLVVDTWARNQVPYPADATVHALFAEQAELRPDSPALVLEDRQMTYAELDAASSALAAALLAEGIPPQARVGICIERSFDLVVGLLAVMKCGGAYVPLDPEYPPARLRFMIEDAEIWAVLTDHAGQPRIRNLGARALLVEALIETPANGPTSIPVSASAPAYLMYTSGSTGQPKGVVIPHRAIVRLVRGTDYANLSADETFLQLSSPSFDAATFEIWGPLLNGGRLVLMPPGTPSIRSIGDAIRDHGVTTLWLTAGLFHAVVDEDPALLRPLRQLLAGGDVLSPDHVRKCLAACPSLRITNGYGPTENTTFSCCYLIPRDADFPSGIPIGRPIANSEAFVLDEELRPVPIGAVGELVVGGDGLGLGYWRRPELTRERFVGHPFSDNPEDRLYRTGDRARFLPDGTIEFLGRRDQQVKIRGFRVELSEIEAVVTRAPGVRQCTVIVRTEPDTEIIAYVVPDQERDDVLETVRSFAREALPSYMIPAHWVVLQKLPLTPNGKVDKRMLPSPERPDRRTSDPPASQLERRLLEVFQRLFQTKEIGCDDDFFDLGGNSLLAIRLVAEVERLTAQQVGISRLFHNPTVRGLARALMQEAPGPKWTSLVPLAPEGSGRPLFIAHGIGGELFAVKEFGRQLGGQHPVFGLQAVEHAGIRERFISFEAMAAHYVAEIRSLQPEGPYYLFGFSLGGMVAFEVAAQLRQAGHEIGMLFLLDAHPPNLPALRRVRMLAPYLAHRFAHHLRISVRSVGRAEYVRARVRALRRHLGPRARPSSQPGNRPIVVSPGVDYYQALGRQYVPVPVDLPVTLIQAADNHRNLRAAWTYLSGRRPTVLRVPGGHMDLVSGASFRMSLQIVRDRLEAAQRRATVQTS